MILSDLSVRRPVLAVVISLLLIAFGAVAFDLLPLREYPDIDPPVVSIETAYRGASAAVVETRITQQIEDRISGIAGVESIASSSMDGVSEITIEFSLERDIDAAEGVDRGGGQALVVLPGGDVRDDGDRRARASALGGERLQLVLRARREDEPVTGGGRGTRRGCADAGRGAGDEEDLIGHGLLLRLGGTQALRQGSHLRSRRSRRERLHVVPPRGARPPRRAGRRRRTGCQRQGRQQHQRLDAQGHQV